MSTLFVYLVIVFNDPKWPYANVLYSTLNEQQCVRMAARKQRQLKGEQRAECHALPLQGAYLKPVEKSTP